MGDSENPTQPVELELVVRLRYMADPAHYGTSDPKELAEVDTINFNEDVDLILGEIANSPEDMVEITVTPVNV